MGLLDAVTGVLGGSGKDGLDLNSVVGLVQELAGGNEQGKDPAELHKKPKQTKSTSAKSTASKSASTSKSATGVKSTAKTSSSKSTSAKSTTAKTSSSKSTATKPATTKTGSPKSKTAKSTGATTTSKSGKKIVDAPMAGSKPASSGGIDMDTILNVAGKLFSSDKNTSGADSGQAHPDMLSNVLGALTGGEGGGLNLASIAELILPILRGNGGMLENFKKHPTQTIEKLIGIDLPDDKIDPIVEMVLGRLGLEK